MIISPIFSSLYVSADNIPPPFGIFTDGNAVGWYQKKVGCQDDPRGFPICLIIVWKSSGIILASNFIANNICPRFPENAYNYRTKSAFSQCSWDPSTSCFCCSLFGGLQSLSSNFSTGPVTHGLTGKNLRFQHVVFYPTKFGPGIPITEFIYIYVSISRPIFKTCEVSMLIPGLLESWDNFGQPQVPQKDGRS